MEVGLCERECRKQKEVNDIEFENIERKELFSGLSETLKSSLERYEIMPATVMQDEDCGMVYFYSLGQKERCRLESITIISFGSCVLQLLAGYLFSFFVRHEYEKFQIKKQNKKKRLKNDEKIKRS